MTESLIRDVVLEVISEWVDRVRPLDGTETFGELDLDSLCRVDIVSELEQELQRDIPCSIFDGEEDPEDLTLNEFARRVEAVFG